MGIKPAKLNVGDVVATVSLSWGGAGLLPDRYAQAKRPDYGHANGVHGKTGL